ncbi:CaiB/BaiF CoA transferase family protein [Jiella sonneratiae]|uniref:CoA transferase n=1 Tax=Jiella sonneratiae TaxID=2816856 RepID=A0ABS3J3I8_9HYPH|nr:CoA transferase [Jiella sonneratiae]MBO0904235.1 CoA transferase [Jiella sonneratiae]
MPMLDDVTIVSFNHFLMGPLGAQILADLGADVIAIEALDGAFQRKWSPNNTYVDGESMLFAAANRNKRSLALDLRNPKGKDIARRLVCTADVVMENFRPGVMDRLGLGYEDVRAMNPGVVYASASGYGPDGPYKDLPGQDLLVQALSGLAAVTGTVEGGARAVGVSAVDHHGAALLAVGVLAALHRARRSGQGSRVDVSLLAAALDLQTESLTAYLNGSRPTDIRQPGHVSGWPMQGPYGIYPARDGDIAISLCSNRELGAALDTPELATIPDEENFPRRDEISSLTARGTRKFTVAELQERLTAHHVWNMPVNDYEKLEADPQVQHNGHIMAVPNAATSATVKLVAHPVSYDGERPAVRLAPQPLGAQSRDILRGLGLTEDEIGKLIADEVVGVPEVKRAPVGYAHNRT